jgi:hypothetical protein
MVIVLLIGLIAAIQRIARPEATLVIHPYYWELSSTAGGRAQQVEASLQLTRRLIADAAVLMRARQSIGLEHSVSELAADLEVHPIANGVKLIYTGNDPVQGAAFVRAVAEAIVAELPRIRSGPITFDIEGQLDDLRSQIETLELQSQALQESIPSITDPAALTGAQTRLAEAQQALSELRVLYQQMLTPQPPQPEFLMVSGASVS